MEEDVYSISHDCDAHNKNKLACSRKEAKKSLESGNVLFDVVHQSRKSKRGGNKSWFLESLRLAVVFLCCKDLSSVSEDTFICN